MGWDGLGRVEKSPYGLSSQVATVYECWRTERGKSDPRYGRISKNRQTKIRARLSDGFSVDELCDAIRGVARDPWEDRPRNDDLLVIFRNREQVEKFLALCSPNGAGAGLDLERARLAREYDAVKARGHTELTREAYYERYGGST